MSLESELLAHQIASLKMAAGLGQSVTPYLDAIKKIIRKEVSGFDAETRTAKRLESLLKKLEKQLNVQTGNWRIDVEKQLKDFARYEIQYQAETIGKWIDINLTEPSVTQVWAAAQFNPVQISPTQFVDFNKWLSSWESNEIARLVMGVKNGFVQGLTTREIIKNVVGAGGLADVSLRNAKTIVQTSVMHVANTARYETFKDNDDIIDGYEWISTLDNRTSNYCRAMDGKVILFTDKKQPRPPGHANCRSSVKPHLPGEFDFLDKGATRASNGATGGKPVSAELTYYSWLQQQPAAFQDEVLGQEKGKIFRNSGIDAETFRKISVDHMGRPLTLKEMAEADKRVASYLSNK